MWFGENCFPFMPGPSLSFLLIEVYLGVRYAKVVRDRAWMLRPQQLVKFMARGMFKMGMCQIWGDWSSCQAKNIGRIPMRKLKAAYRLTSVHYVFQEGCLGKDPVIGFLEPRSLSAIFSVLKKSPYKQSNRWVIRFNGINIFVKTSWTWFKGHIVFDAQESYRFIMKLRICGYGFRRSIYVLIIKPASNILRRQQS